jgi:hypothetical protein
MLQSGDESEQHEHNHRRECENPNPLRRGWHQREFETDGLASEQAVDTENAKCDAKQSEEDENNPRTWKIVPAFDADETCLLRPIRRITKEQRRTTEQTEEQNNQQSVEELHSTYHVRDVRRVNP